MTKTERKEIMRALDRLSLILVIIGAINWGSIGIFAFDLIRWTTVEPLRAWARVAFVLVGLAGIWCISLLFRSRNTVLDDEI